MKAQVIRQYADMSIVRITGAPTSPDWLHSLRVPPNEAWCEITVKTNSPDYVYGFGGEVWPMAWPALFTPCPFNNYAKGSNSLTADGRALVCAAINDAATVAA